MALMAFAVRYLFRTVVTSLRPQAPRIIFIIWRRRSNRLVDNIIRVISGIIQLISIIQLINTIVRIIHYIILLINGTSFN